MTTIEEVRNMMPVVTDETLPEGEQGQMLYDIAAQNVTGLTGIVETQGYCYYIAYLMTAKEEKQGITSEHLGSYSVTYANTDNRYWKLYNSLLSKTTSKGGYFGVRDKEEGWIFQ